MADIKGPVSSDVAEAKTFTPRLKVSSPQIQGMGNTSNEAQSKIMGLRYSNSGGFGSSNVESVMTKVPKK